MNKEKQYNRILMKADAAPEPIVSEGGQVLGVFLPGFGYWITPQNLSTVRKVLGDGRADPDFREAAADNELASRPGQILGSIEVQT